MSDGWQRKHRKRLPRRFPLVICRADVPEYRDLSVVRWQILFSRDVVQRGSCTAPIRCPPVHWLAAREFVGSWLGVLEIADNRRFSMSQMATFTAGRSGIAGLSVMPLSRRLSADQFSDEEIDLFSQTGTGVAEGSSISSCDFCLSEPE